MTSKSGQGLVNYDSSSSNDEETEGDNVSGGSYSSRIKVDLKKYNMCPAPIIEDSEMKELNLKYGDKKIDFKNSKELNYNPRYDELFSSEVASDNQPRPIRKKNTLTGYVEPAHIDECQFELQRKSFHFKGVAANPSDGSSINDEIKRNKYSLVSTSSTVDTKHSLPDGTKHTDKQSEESQTNLDNIQIGGESSVASAAKRKKIKNDDPSDIEGYLGPWGGYENEERVSKPKEEDAIILAEYLAKKQKRYQTAKSDDADFQEKAVVHIKDPYDYQGRSFLHAPRDLDGINLNSETSPEGCRVPKSLTHTYNGHSKAISAIRYFPKSAHLLLSCSMDQKIKIWEVYKERRCVMTYLGHKQAVRDVNFDQNGEKFVSAGYDKYLKLWDTETGQCIKRFTNKKIAYCVKFNPDPERSHLFLAGMADKKILCWDTRTGEIVQEYDRHLGSVNSITFVDENRKFITTSDDKSLRVWEWDIPVDVKYIADPTLHSMPAVTPSSNCKRLLCQSMDNKIQTFTCQNRFKLDTKKVFKGHMVAGYACVPDFSCDMKMVISGDADGRIFFWDWSSTKIITSFKAHDNVCISVLWHPHERQKLISAGWDNLIKIWE